VARRRTKRWRLPVRLLLSISGALVVAITATIGVLALTWPDVAGLATDQPQTTAFIERARASGVDVEWHWTPYHRISDPLKKAVVVAEDMSFFSHRGFDTHEIAVAAREAVQGKRLRGASTITQQVAKNLWLTPSRSPVRKLREVVLTRQLERHLSKQRILEIYLNVAQFGPEIFGVEAAARDYFGCSAAEIVAEQAAQLAASLPRPTRWHPGVESRGYRRSCARILARMEQVAWLDSLL
jgi:monofunctional biosynthetic peptidoglycan transglycosylase